MSILGAGAIEGAHDIGCRKSRARRFQPPEAIGRQVANGFTGTTNLPCPFEPRLPVAPFWSDQTRLRGTMLRFGVRRQKESGAVPGFLATPLFPMHDPAEPEYPKMRDFARGKRRRQESSPKTSDSFCRRTPKRNTFRAGPTSECRNSLTDPIHSNPAKPAKVSCNPAASLVPLARFFCVLF